MFLLVKKNPQWRFPVILNVVKDELKESDVGGTPLDTFKTSVGS